MPPAVGTQGASLPAAEPSQGAASGVWRRLSVVGVLAALVAVAFALEVPFCPTATLLGVPCPGCGLTRATLLLMRGELAQALRFHPLVWVLAPLYLGLIAAAALGYVRGPRAPAKAARPSLWLDRRLTRAAWALLALVLAVWLARFFGAFGGPAPVRSLAAPLLSDLWMELRR